MSHTFRKNLVIVRASNDSLHPKWLEGDAERSWDIVVSYFGDQAHLYREPDVCRIDSKGPKWPALQELFTSYPQFISNYAYIWLPDDDIMATKSDINHLFDAASNYKLEVAQPSLTWDSYYSHLSTLQNRRTKIRFTNYVEIMAPCFSSTVLRKALPLLASNMSGWGLDHVWSRLVDDPINGIAIIDYIAVRHTRPVGGPNYKALREKGISPWDEFRTFCKANGIDEEPIIATHKAIRQNGTIVMFDQNPSQFMWDFILGYLPAVAHTYDRRRMLRRIAGGSWKFLWNMPDRVSEHGMVYSRLLQNLFERPIRSAKHPRRDR